MIDVPPFKVQEICCDATSPNIPDKASFFFKSSYHNISEKGKVRVDFSLHIIKQPVQPLGIWRCRVNFWLSASTTEINYEQGFEYYKEGFRRALTEAEMFVKLKYKVNSISPPPTDTELLEKYKAILAKQNASEQK